MPITQNEFEEKYPAFVGLADDFSDPPPGHTSDEETARKIRSNWGPADRIVIFNELLADSGRILDSIGTEWDALGNFVNRHFRDDASAKKWLLKVRGEWLKELSRLQNETT